MVNGNGRNGHCPRCWHGPELFREGEDAICLFCGFRLSYYTTLLPDELSALYDASREIAGTMAPHYPLPGQGRHGFSVPA